MVRSIKECADDALGRPLGKADVLGERGSVAKGLGAREGRLSDKTGFAGALDMADELIFVEIGRVRLSGGAEPGIAPSAC